MTFIRKANDLCDKLNISELIDAVIQNRIICDQGVSNLENALLTNLGSLFPDAKGTEIPHINIDVKSDIVSLSCVVVWEEGDRYELQAETLKRLKAYFTASYPHMIVQIEDRYVAPYRDGAAIAHTIMLLNRN